jgi:hypothetical protein
MEVTYTVLSYTVLSYTVLTHTVPMEVDTINWITMKGNLWETEARQGEWAPSVASAASVLDPYIA